MGGGGLTPPGVPVGGRGDTAKAYWPGDGPYWKSKVLP